MKTNDVVSQIGLTIVVEEEETVKSSLSKTTEEKYMKQSSRTYSTGIVSPTMKEGTQRKLTKEKLCLRVCALNLHSGGRGGLPWIDQAAV